METYKLDGILVNNGKVYAQIDDKIFLAVLCIGNVAAPGLANPSPKRMYCSSLIQRVFTLAGGKVQRFPVLPHVNPGLKTPDIFRSQWVNGSWAEFGDSLIDLQKHINIHDVFDRPGETSSISMYVALVPATYTFRIIHMENYEAVDIILESELHVAIID